MTLKINTVVSSVKTPLAVGPTTPVIVRVFKANGEFGNPDTFDASRVIVTEG